MPDDCVFCRIASKQIPVDAVYEDDEFIAFHDMNKQAPVHVLVIPKAHVSTLLEVTDAGFAGRALLTATTTARLMNLAEDGFRLVINCGDDGGQTVYHFHIHVLGGRFMQWPPG